MEASLTYPNGKTELCSIMDLEHDLYDIKFTPEMDGVHTVSFKAEGSTYIRFVTVHSCVFRTVISNHMTYTLFLGTFCVFMICFLYLYDQEVLSSIQLVLYQMLGHTRLKLVALVWKREKLDIIVCTQ